VRRLAASEIDRDLSFFSFNSMLFRPQENWEDQRRKTSIEKNQNGF
jgi:hypothetical protein